MCEYKVYLACRSVLCHQEVSRMVMGCAWFTEKEKNHRTLFTVSKQQRIGGYMFYLWLTMQYLPVCLGGAAHGKLHKAI